MVFTRLKREQKRTTEEAEDCEESKVKPNSVENTRRTGSLQETGGRVGNLVMNAGECEYYRQNGIEMERII